MIPHFLPKFFFDKPIYSYVEGLVSKGVKRYNDLNKEQKYKISALIIREMGADDFESLVGSDNCTDTMNVFANALFNNSEESDIKLLNFIKMNAVSNHAWQIDELISEIRSINRVSKNMEEGLFPYTDPDTGELLWRKSA